ncbi:MAG: hypothetical protein HQL95_15935, partial [Magnetococcales bacterium]|nr:hypothetical protein [Magnetococcales bacterium]
MTPQQVNFYHDMFRPRFDPLEAKTILLFILGTILLAILATGGMQWRLETDRTRLKSLQQNKDAAANRVAELSAIYPLKGASPELTRTSERLEREKMRKSRMLSLFNDGRIGEAKGFSPVFHELATARTDGVWLTGIGVFEAGNHLLIEGAAERATPDRIPLLLESITKRPVFKERHFSHLQIKQAEEKTGLLHFQLKTDPEKTLERFWEEKEQSGPPVVQQVNREIERSRGEMKKTRDAVKSPPGLKPG